jgi:hypothetical protein
MKEVQTFSIADYLVQAAGIAHPWRAVQYRVDEVATIVHVWITRQPRPNVEKKRSWFNFSPVESFTETPSSGPEMQWRHLNCMHFSCQIHTTDVLDERHFDLPWFGQPGLPFSNRLSRQIFICLAEGMEMHTICDILNIPFTELWKFKHALDNGHVKFEYTPTKKVDPSGTAQTSAQQASANASNVPDVEDPIWEHLITGAINIHIKTLSLQLILTKLRQQVSLQQNDEVKRLKLRELHKYVERNQRSLGYELNQFKELSQTEAV